MTKQLAAVLGTGQTKYVAKRQDVSMNGLVREAIDKALADSGSTMDDIDAVVVGWGYGQADFSDATAATSGLVHVATVAELRRALGV